MEIKYGPEFKKSWDRLFSYNPCYLIPRLFRDATFKIKMAYQRVFRGYDDTAWWNYNFWFQENTIEILEILKKHHVGCPHEYFDAKAKNNECHRWEDEVVQPIIDGMKAGIEMDDVHTLDKNGNIDLDAQEKEWERLKVKRDRAFDLLKEHIDGLWD